MSWIPHPMSFSYGFFAWKRFKKTRYPNVTNSASHVSFIWIFPWKRQKKLDTQMSWIQHPMSFLSGFFYDTVKTSSVPKMSQIQHPMSVLSRFSHENVKKSSIPKCHELNIRCHLYIDFSMKISKNSIPKCHKLSMQCHFYLDFSMKMSKKTRYPNVMNSTSDVMFISVFAWKT